MEQKKDVFHERINDIFYLAANQIPEFKDHERDTRTIYSRPYDEYGLEFRIHIKTNSVYLLEYFSNNKNKDELDLLMSIAKHNRSLKFVKHGKVHAYFDDLADIDDQVIIDRFTDFSTTIKTTIETIKKGNKE